MHEKRWSTFEYGKKRNNHLMLFCGKLIVGLFSLNLEGALDTRQKKRKTREEKMGVMDSFRPLWTISNSRIKQLAPDAAHALVT
jgi:hypothetical protein